MLRKRDEIPAAVAAGIVKKEATEMRKTDARKTIVQVVCAALIFLLIVAFSCLVLLCLKRQTLRNTKGPTPFSAARRLA